MKFYLRGLMILLVLISCHSQNNQNFEAGLSEDGKFNLLKIYESNQKDFKVLTFTTTGRLFKIENYRDSAKFEELFFNDSTGRMISKISYKFNKPNGAAYRFFESGNLRSSRSIINNVENDIGFNYWDKDIVINKELLRFDHKGKLYYRLYFDDHGNPLNSEGDEYIDSLKR